MQKKKHTVIDKLNQIKAGFYTGFYSYDEAKKLAVPWIKKFNTRAKEIANKHGVKPKYMTFSGFMR